MLAFVIMLRHFSTWLCRAFSLSQNFSSIPTHLYSFYYFRDVILFEFYFITAWRHNRSFRKGYRVLGLREDFYVASVNFI